MDDEQVIELDVGCHPEAAISGGMLFQSEERCVLTFNAMSNTPAANGRFQAVGTAVVEFKRAKTRFGGPNDEGLDEHPLYDKGLKEVGYAVCEVLHSSWAKEWAKQAELTARRIFGKRYERACANENWVQRHFIITFHDSTFECLADDVSVAIYDEPFDRIVHRVMQILGTC